MENSDDEIFLNFCNNSSALFDAVADERWNVISHVSHFNKENAVLISKYIFNVVESNIEHHGPYIFYCKQLIGQEIVFYFEF